MLTTRDKLHDLWRGGMLKWKMGALIMTGGVISYLTQPSTGSVATASIVAFTASEAIDAVVYHRTGSINKSNAVGALVDSLLFPVIAFGGFAAWVFAGQFITKTVGGYMWAVVLKRSSLFITLFMLICCGAADAADMSVQLHMSRGGAVCTTEASIGKEVFAFIDYSDAVTYGEASFTPQLWAINPTAQVEFGNASDFQLPTVGLFGAEYRGLQVLYRSDGLAQVTYVWFKQFGRVQFTGFVDVTNDCVMAQPQLWLRVGDGVYAGSEIRVTTKSVIPTIGVKCAL